MALVIETSVETGSVALVTPEKTLFEQSFLAGRKPSATLWTPLSEALQLAPDLAVVVVGTGPGSYNGVRISIAAAQGVALIRGCRAVGICSFEGVEMTSREGLAIGDARRGGFSAQHLAEGKPEGAVALLSKKDLEERILSAASAGQEVFCFEDRARFGLAPEVETHVTRRQSQASRLGASYWNRSLAERKNLVTDALEPIYLRAPHITAGKRPSLLDRG